MVGDHDTGYLAALSADQRATLKRVNAPGLAALRGYLESGEAVAFLGAGASAPLYPLWAGLIGDLVDAAAARMDETAAATCRALALTAPEEAVEIVRRRLGGPSYHAVLREVLRVRTGPDTGRAFGGAELPVLYARRPECAPDRGKRVGRDWQDCPRHPLGSEGGRDHATAGAARGVRVELLRRPLRRALGRCAPEMGATGPRRARVPDRSGGGAGAAGARRARGGAGRPSRRRVRAAAGRAAGGGRLPERERQEFRLAGWTPGMVRAAVSDRLAGLATWHPDSTISTHPLVRDTFRPLALPAAATAADTSLTGLPAGDVTSRADARRVTEAIATGNRDALAQAATTPTPRDGWRSATACPGMNSTP